MARREPGATGPMTISGAWAGCRGMEKEVTPCMGIFREAALAEELAVVDDWVI